ncbi:MAG TPA: Ig-like domain-containing protein [Acidobacteriaceae bacterium]
MISRRPASFLFSIFVLPLALSFAGCNSLKDISILPGAGSVQLTSVGQTVQFTAVGSQQMGSATPSTSNITNQVTWSVSNPSVATINQSGLAAAVGNGTTQVMAESNGITATSDITVTVSNTSGSGSGSPFITITPGSATETFVGETTQFEATGSLTGGASQNLNSLVTWISSNVQVASINTTGLATAVGAGTTTIIAQSGGTNTTATLTVNVASNSSNAVITIVPTSATATFQGETTQFIALGTLTAGGPTQNITSNLSWSSSDVAVATVDQNGLATAVGNNLTSEATTITAIGTTSTGSLISATATLTVLPASGQGSQTTLPTLAVYMTGTGAGTITSSPGTIACGVINGTCTNNFAKTTVVTLTATPTGSASFAGWSSTCVPVLASATDAKSGQHLQCTITMSNNMTVGGIFNP